MTAECGRHDGPCLNYPGQLPDDYCEYDSCYLHIEASQRWRNEIVGIVRAVAGCEPMAYCPGDDMYGDWYECGFCGVQADSVSRYDEWKPVEHRPDCEWRRAREWADADGGDDGGP